MRALRSRPPLKPKVGWKIDLTPRLSSLPINMGDAAKYNSGAHYHLADRGPKISVPRAFGVGFHTGFPSRRFISSNVETWVLSNQDSSIAPQTLQDA